MILFLFEVAFDVIIQTSKLINQDNVSLVFEHEKDENLAPQSLRIALLWGKYNEFMNLQ